MFYFSFQPSFSHLLDIDMFTFCVPSCMDNFSLNAAQVATGLQFDMWNFFRGPL